MKKLLSLLPFALCVLFISSCASLPKLFNQAQTWVEKNCPKTEIKNPITGDIDIYFECDSLWKTDKITARCDNAKVCIDIANGQISAKVRCTDVIPVPSVKP